MPAISSGIDGLVPPQELIVHNATDEAIAMQYDGETVIIPPFSEVVKQDKLHSDVPHSARDEHGNYIKGTIIVKDRLGARAIADGERPDRWSAADCIRHVLGIDVQSRRAFGVLAIKGVSYVPPNAKAADIAKIATEGRVRYSKWLEANAAQMVADYEERNAARVKHGDKPLAPDRMVRTAQRVLEASRKRDGAEAEETILELERIMAPAVPTTPDDDARLKELLKGLAGQIAAENDLKGDAQLLAERALANPDVMTILRTQMAMEKLRESRKKQDKAEDKGQVGVPTKLPQG